ncbi:MAG: hydrolase [Clostridia bacterium]|nr:hydrolase [Clostridia bacterium]
MNNQDIASKKQIFLDIFKENVNREGADLLLEYLESTDFFTAPASTRFHCAYPGGLLEHSLNVYYCLKDYLSRPRTKEQYHMDYSDESIAIVSLLHDLCKVNVYKESFRNVKDDNGVWQKVPCYEFDDHMAYGHGEKSVYIINGFMRLSREEAFAIRYHMGFSGNDDKNTVGKVMGQFPLAFALCTADMEATSFLE